MQLNPLHQLIHILLDYSQLFTLSILIGYANLNE